MDFDLTKFYQSRVTAVQLRGMLATLSRFDEYVKRASRKRTIAIALSVVAWVGLAIFLATTNSALFSAATALCLLGGAFVYVTGLLGRAIANRKRGDIATSLVLLVMPGFFLYSVTVSTVGSAAAAIGHPHLGIPAALMASAFVAHLFFFLGGVRWGALVPQKVELDYLARVALPLLADLPKGTRGDVVFNPFKGEWSQIKMPVPTRAGYSFDATSDIIIRLRIPLDEHRDLRLSVVEQTLTKTKDRKAKYKGTKRRLIVRYDMQLAPGAEIDAGVSLEKVLGAAKLETPSRVVVDRGRITVLQIKKSADSNRELLESHLVPPAHILGTVRAMTEASLPKTA